MYTSTQPIRVSMAALTVMTLLGSWSAWAVNDEPLTDKWAPSEWGPRRYGRVRESHHAGDGAERSQARKTR